MRDDIRKLVKVSLMFLLLSSNYSIAGFRDCWMYLAPAERSGAVLKKSMDISSDEKLYQYVRGLEIDRQIEKGYKTRLASGKIKFVYIGVHPLWGWMSHTELQSYKKFAVRLAQSPNAAFILVPWFSFDENHALKDGKLSDSVRNLMEYVLYAKRILGDRFILWPAKHRYVFANTDGRDRGSEDWVKSALNPVAEMGDDYFAQHDNPNWRTPRRNPKWFNRIIVFGKEWGSCAQAQATLMHLQSWTHSIFQGNEAPCYPYPESYQGEISHDPQWYRGGGGGAIRWYPRSEHQKEFETLEIQRTGR